MIGQLVYLKGCLFWSVTWPPCLMAANSEGWARPTERKREGRRGKKKTVETHTCAQGKRVVILEYDNSMNKQNKQYITNQINGPIACLGQWHGGGDVTRSVRAEVYDTTRRWC